MNTEAFKIFSFEQTRDSSTYIERIGEPIEFHAVIGLISLKFQILEDNITSKLIEMIGLSKEIGMILTAELSFKNKAHLFSSLCNHLKDSHRFNYLRGYEDVEISSFVKAFFKCEEMRNKILHSSIKVDYMSKKILRKKITAKARQGLKTVEEVVDISYLMDVADFCGQIDYALDEFFIYFG